MSDVRCLIFTPHCSTLPPHELKIHRGPRKGRVSISCSMYDVHSADCKQENHFRVVLFVFYPSICSMFPTIKHRIIFYLAKKHPNSCICAFFVVPLRGNRKKTSERMGIKSFLKSDYHTKKHKFHKWLHRNDWEKKHSPSLFSRIRNEIYYNFHSKDCLVVDGKSNYIFLDEIQNVAEFQRLVDSLYIKPNVDVYITGSNAYMLSGELATLLTGRYVEINILPLQFSEYYYFMISKSPNLSKQEILANYIYYGGVPEYAKQLSVSEKQADLFAQSILKTIVEKDIFQRLNITNKHDFNKILDYVFDTVGSYVSPRSISDTLRSNGTIIDKQTVAKYLDALCEAYLIYKVPRFEIKGKGLLQTLNKFLCCGPMFC